MIQILKFLRLLRIYLAWMENPRVILALLSLWDRPRGYVFSIWTRGDPHYLRGLFFIALYRAIQCFIRSTPDEKMGSIGEIIRRERHNNLFFSLFFSSWRNCSPNTIYRPRTIKKGGVLCFPFGTGNKRQSGRTRIQRICVFWI